MASSAPAQPLPPTPPGAVFLSYAREDNEAARRIADALRAFGVEVWFDQNELRGGDSWDAKIKQQIRECALFVPIVSAQTEERTEGYFRREWLLAVERTRDMAAGRAFIVPVVIDETREADAAVPEEFMRYQWTRLARGVPSPQFVEQIRRLLEAPKKTSAVGRVSDPPSEHLTREKAGHRPALPRTSRQPWVLVAVTTIVAAVSVFLWRQSQPLPTPTAATPAAPREKSAPSVPASELRQLIAKAWTLWDKQDDATRDDWNLADDLCRRAIALDPSSAEAWAASSQISLGFVIFGFDLTPARTETARTQAERAVRLAPESDEARFAQANFYRRQRATMGEGVRMLRELAQRLPNDKRVLKTLASGLRGQGRHEESLIFSDKAIALPGGDRVALYGKESALAILGRLVEAESALDQALAMGPSPAVYINKLFYHLEVRGDLEQARANIEKLPTPFLLEDWGAYHASRVWLWRREGDQAIAVLRAVSRDYLEKAPYIGPKGYLTGMAHRVAGRLDAARSEWQGALSVVDQRLAARPNDISLLSWRALLLAETGQRESAEKILPILEQSPRGNEPGASIILIRVALGQTKTVTDSLERMFKGDYYVGLLNRIRFDPAYDPLRNNPQFQALLKSLPAAPNAKK